MKFINKSILIFFVLLCTLTPTFAAETDLPASYDLRDVNGQSYVTPVKNQRYFGTCWAHGALAAIESNSILKGGSPTINLSEKALAWFAYQLQGTRKMNPEEYEGMDAFQFDSSWQFEQTSQVYSVGGDDLTALSQLINWLGCSTEAEIPYLNSQNSYLSSNGEAISNPLGDWTLPYSDIYDDAFHVQNSEFIFGPGRKGLSSEEFTPKAKELILKYGALSMFYKAYKEECDYFNADTSSQYINVVTQSSHCVTIVGWDDNYPASNFNITPPGDGAWIVKNSWGEDWGDGGYFYLSYYDQSICVAEGWDAQTEQEDFSYDQNNQYDIYNFRGDYYDVSISTMTQELNLQNLDEGDIKMANVFTSERNSTLRAVSASPVINGSSKVTANVYILNENYTNPEDGQLVSTVTQTFENPGYYTLELSDPISLPAGTKYSVVEQLTYYNAQFQDVDTDFLEPIPELQSVEVEFGIADPYFQNMIDDEGNDIGFTAVKDTVTVEPGESYLYGFNGTIGVTPPTWNDITEPEIYDKLNMPVEINNPVNGTISKSEMVPGNVMIKSFTTYGIGDDNINPSSITLTQGSLDSGNYYLTTVSGGRNSIEIGAVLEPSNSTVDINWSASPSNVVSVEGDGTKATVTALNEGEATITATTYNNLVATVKFIVNNNEITCDGLDFISYTPDSFTVIARNVSRNTAIPNSKSPQQLSLFTWSAANQSDINAKVMRQIPGTNDWIYESIPVNDTGAHNYFVHADHIYAHVYGSSELNSNGNLIRTGNYDWFLPSSADSPLVAYIAYCQNTGFVTPTVFSGQTSGNINDPYSQHLEGFRISSGLEGIELNSTVYAQGLGWLDTVSDGTYAGTMGENRALESIVIDMKSDIPYFTDLIGCQYRVYIKDSGWTAWIPAGQEAGTPGSGKPIQALQVSLVQKENSSN